MKFRLLIVALASIAVLSGCGNSSDPVRVDPTIDSSAPGVPTGLYVENQLDGTRWVFWNPIPASDLAGYLVYRYNPDIGNTETSYEMVAELPQVQNRYQLPEIEPGGSITIRVRSINNGGKMSGYSAALTVDYFDYKHGQLGEPKDGLDEDLP